MLLIGDEIKEFARRQGADLVGFAPVERLAGAPPGTRPEDSLPNARSVIALAKRCSSGGIEAGRPSNYRREMAVIVDQLDALAVAVVNFIERRGWRAVPIPADDPFDTWDGEQEIVRGNISHKHVAQAAGLGVVGKNSLLITPRYGNRVYLVSVVTDVELQADELLAENLCLECGACLRACPVQAIGPDGIVSQRLCRQNTDVQTEWGFSFFDCWACRSVCPQGSGVIQPRDRCEQLDFFMK
jgi:epoxyqueuosine reductase QueG